MSSKRQSKYNVILLNDKHNTFEHVIHCLMEICNHNYYQAGQCAHIVHHKGECSVFISKKTEASDVYEMLKIEGLSVLLRKK